VTTVLCITIAIALAAAEAFATNGMNMEGYGPEATALGGASMAFDNGPAAFMNNPATIGLMERESSRIDVALGILRPTVAAELPSAMGLPAADSDATMFLMPAFGWIRAQGPVTYGLCVFSQGGMGTEYAGDTFMAAQTGEKVMSQVGVGRFGVPLSYEATEQLIVGGSLDFVWAGMDLRMAMDGMSFGDFVAGMGGTQTYGSASGTMVDGLVDAVTFGMLNQLGPVNTTRFDFADDSDFTNQATGTGIAAKLGLVYKVNEQLALGGTYHAQTVLSDLDTPDATLTMSANYDDNILNQTWDPMGGTGAPAGTYTATEVPVTGSVKVLDFQWPAQYGIGASYKVNDKWTVAADLKQILWSEVMDSFRMEFEANATQANPMAAGFAGSKMKMEMFQNWDDQTVISLGAAFKPSEKLVLRAGLNLSANPVPDTYLNALFPAIEENHFALGAGYQVTDNSWINLSTTIVPEVSAEAGSQVTSKHSQNNYQLTYAITF